MDRLPIRSRTLRGQVLLPLAAVLAVAVLGVGIACTLAARDAAGQRVAERATTAHSLLERRLDGKRAPSRDQISSAVRDVAAQLGVGVSVDAGKGPASAASVSGSTKT